ncbi:MAG TPA: transketolase [bacterium]
MAAGTLNLSIDELREMARTIRRDVLIMTHSAKSGHPGGPLSMADYATALVFNYLRVDPEDAHIEPRDRFIVSNGHCSAYNYAVLARRGFFDWRYLPTFRSFLSGLEGHPNRHKAYGVEVSAGSLGHGLSIGHGLALGAKLAAKDERVYVNVGDGELQEGSCWEAIMAAGHYKTDNMLVTVDYNDAQIDGRMTDVMDIRPLDGKFRSFKWHVIEADGHDMAEILKTYDRAHDAMGHGQPVCIIFHTIMMKGVPTYEDDFLWHGRPLKEEEVLELALKELGYNETAQEAVASYGDRGEARASYHAKMGWPVPESEEYYAIGPFVEFPS